MRFPEWPRDHPTQPNLGDIACQESGPDAGDSDYVRRAYVIVGVQETATGFRLTMERVEYGTLPESLDAERIWAFSNAPRR